MPDGASVDRVQRRITFHIGELINPSIVVPTGADVRIQVINADDDMARGLIVARPGTSTAWMPMMTRPAFPAAAVCALGEACGAQQPAFGRGPFLSTVEFSEPTCSAASSMNSDLRLLS